MEEKNEKMSFPGTEIVCDRIDYESNCETCDCEEDLTGELEFEESEENVFKRTKRFLATTVYALGFVDTDFGLDDLLEKQHFWNMVMVSSVFVCVSIIADAMIGDFFTFSTVALQFSVILVLFVGLGVHIKRTREAVADRLNSIDFSQSRPEELRKQLAINDVDFVNMDVLKALEDDREITWRDVR